MDEPPVLMDVWLIEVYRENEDLTLVLRGKGSKDYTRSFKCLEHVLEFLRTRVVMAPENWNHK